MTFKEKIYLADKALLKIIVSDFDIIDDKGWYLLYKHRADGTFWRLDKWDKYQVQCFVRLDTSECWVDFDDKELRIELLSKTRGLSNDTCIWGGCTMFALRGLAYCALHAYEKMGIRE